MKIISVRLAESIQLDARDMPQNQWWNDSPDIEPQLRSRCALVTIEPPFVVIRKGNRERRLPLTSVKWIETEPEQTIEEPRPFIASKEPLTEEEEAAGLTAVPSGPQRRASRARKAPGGA